jgi:hypothetical protein
MDEHEYNKDTVGWGQRSEAAPGCNLRDLPALLWSLTGGTISYPSLLCTPRFH